MKCAICNKEIGFYDIGIFRNPVCLLCKKKITGGIGSHTVKMETNEDLEKQFGVYAPTVIADVTREVVQAFVDDLPDSSKEKLSDGYHTFKELYDHRTVLWIALCNALHREYPVWRSRLHSDGTSYEGYFILGLFRAEGQQITYHVQDKWWDACSFAVTDERAPVFDGHASDDVLKRLLDTMKPLDKGLGQVEG